MAATLTDAPDIGDYVLVPSCVLLAGPAKVIAFEGRRPVVQSVTHPNITVALGSRTRVLRERCRDAEHPDCLASEELGIDCARWTRERLAGRASVA